MSQPAPTYAAMRANYPSKRHGIPMEKLYKSIGWDDLIDNGAYTNTCATRVSLSLLGAGYNFPGRMKIKAGPFKGRMIEPGQARLSNILARPEYFGKPEIYKGEPAAVAGIGRRRGLVSFFNIDVFDANNPQGHMDLISDESGGIDCVGSCTWTARTIWFWPLK